MKHSILKTQILISWKFNVLGKGKGKGKRKNEKEKGKREKGKGKVNG